MYTTYFRALAKVIIIIFFISFVPSRLNAQQIAIGTYTGNGGTAQNISGLGFTPVAVLVQKAGSATAFIGTNTMGGNVKLSGSGALVSNYITAYGAGYFTIGTNSGNANTTATTYYYVAWSSAAVATGTFTGTGVTQSVSVGFNPYMVWAIPASSTWPSYSQMNMRSSTSNVFKMEGTGAVDWHKEYLGAYGATIFNVHEYASTTETYHYVAFNSGSTGFYEGTAVTHSEVTVVASSPVFILAKDQEVALKLQ